MPQQTAAFIQRAWRWVWKWVSKLLLILGFTVATVTFLPILQPWINAFTGPWTEARGDILVVLGNETSPDGLVGQKSYWRCVYAVLAWRQGGFREIVVSGGGGISAAMRNFLIGSGVPASAVREESESMSTRENALFVSRMLGPSPGRVVLLTSDFHMYRAYRAFLKAGLRVEPRPFPDAGKNANSLPMRWPVFIELVEETVKIADYRFKDWI